MRELRQPIGVIARHLGGYYYGGMLTGIHQVARKAVPATVLHRRSCGCLTLDERLAANDADCAAANWQARLLRQLVQVIRYPLPLDPSVLPDQIWPGAGMWPLRRLPMASSSSSWPKHSGFDDFSGHLCLPIDQRLRARIRPIEHNKRSGYRDVV